MAMFFYICEYLHISPEDFFATDVGSPEKIKRITANLISLDDQSLDSIATIVEKLSNQK